MAFRTPIEKHYIQHKNNRQTFGFSKGVWIMNIQALRYVVQIGEIGSINKAAQQLYIHNRHLAEQFRKLKKQQDSLSFNAAVKASL